MKYIYDLHRTMLSQSLILVYEGEFTQEITKSVLAMAERNMDSFGEQDKVKKKVFNVMVECLQNICKHSASFDEETYGKNNAIFMIGKTEDAYVITSGNAMVTHEVASLSDRLTKVNALDEAGLKAAYKERMLLMKGKDLSDKGGAGLGFIDIRRRAGSVLKFDFETMDEHLSFFSLKIAVARVAAAGE